jgi:uncharacterized protein YceH (UPF0502 family)
MSTVSQSTDQPPSPRWRQISAIERRVLGVLIEKAKTTPENYPLSLNSLRSGCNQKSNRAPLMQLEEDQVEEALESLRQIGAVAQIQGGARVDKYRHLAYDWLGVEKVELAVMAELLLRGSQTIGELRGRAARMEPIKGLAELQPTLDALESKGLIVYLTPPGRGSVVTHTLYLDQEMEKIRREAGTVPPPAGEPVGEPAVPRLSSPTSAGGQPPTTDRTRSLPNATDTTALADDVRRLQQELAAVKQDFLAARNEFETMAEELRRELNELNRQLGN